MTELLIAKQPDLIGIVETWLDVSVPDPAVFCGLPYTVIGRFNRPERQHGGLLLAISNSLSNSIEVSDARIEELFISCLLKFESSYLGLVLVYLPPKGSKFYVSMSEATEKLRFVMTNFEKMRVSNCSGELHTIILGDFNFPSVNLDCMKSSRSDEQILIDFLAQDFLMDQIIRNPTHKHENILDLAFVSQAEAWDYELLSSKLSDHTPVLLTYSAKYIPCNNFLSEYSLSSFDETAFLQSLNIDSRLPNSPIIGNSNQCFSSLWLSNFQSSNQSIPNSRTVLLTSFKKPPRIFSCQKFVSTVFSYASFLGIFRQVLLRLVTVFHLFFTVLVPNCLHLMFTLSSALSYKQLAGHYSGNALM